MSFNEVKKMTPNKLRKYKGFENKNNDEAEIVIADLKKLASILYEHISNEMKKEEDNQLFLL